MTWTIALGEQLHVVVHVHAYMQQRETRSHHDLHYIVCCVLMTT